MTSTGVSAIPLLVGAAVSFPAPRGRTLCNHYRKFFMTPPTNDPMLPVILSKLTAIERSIDKLASHVATQNGRIGKLESAQAAESAVDQHIREDVAALDKADERRYRKVTALISALAAVFGGVLAVIVGQVMQ